MKTIDLHCDTIFELYEAGGGDLYRNGGCVDLARLQEGGSLLQCFALYDKEEKYHYDYEHLKYFIAFFDALVKKHGLNQVFSYAGIKANTLNILLTLEDCGAVQARHERIDAHMRQARGWPRPYGTEKIASARRMLRRSPSHTGSRRSALKRSATSKSRDHRRCLAHVG
jgi:hypothetical protein